MLRSRLASPITRLALVAMLLSAVGLTWTVRGPTVTRPGQVIDLTRRLGVTGGRGRLLLTTVEHGPIPVWRLVVGKVAGLGRSVVHADGPTNTAAQMFDAKTDAWLNALNLVESPGGLSRETRADMLKLMPTVNTDRITGPSGGLMLALAFASLLGGGDLTGGRVVAGTGTIDRNGDVGEIGYASYKVRGAAAAGATVFFVPAGNWTDAARAAPAGVQVVAVSTFTEALVWLCQHGGHSFACDRLAAAPA